MKSNPVLWFRRFSLTLAILGVIGGVWMVFSGLVLNRVCREPFTAYPLTDPETGSGYWVCWGDQGITGAVKWQIFQDDYARPMPDIGQAGAGVAAVLFFLWAYALCLAVARKLEQKSTPEAAPKGGAAP